MIVECDVLAILVKSYDKYVNGEYDKDKTFTENPGYVPYSLEMPDYLELNFC